MVGHLSRNELVLKTVVGDLSFSVTAKDGDLSSGEIVSAMLEPFIPDGMEVEDSIAVLFRVKSSTQIKHLNFACTWSQSIGPGGSCTGQGLDAWEWEKDHYLVVIGTQDDERLSARLNPKFLSDSPIVMSSNGFEIHIEEYPKGEELTLHYIVSSNSLPEKEECSCWFAVDVAHQRVIEACQ